MQSGSIRVWIRCRRRCRRRWSVYFHRGHPRIIHFVGHHQSHTYGWILIHVSPQQGFGGNNTSQSLVSRFMRLVDFAAKRTKS
jgi:hypothetical protein